MFFKGFLHVSVWVYKAALFMACMGNGRLKYGNVNHSWGVGCGGGVTVAPRGSGVWLSACGEFDRYS